MCVILTRRQANTLPRRTCPPYLFEPTPRAQINAPSINIADAVIDLPQVLAGKKNSVHVIARIPNGARIKAAEALLELLHNVSQNKTEYA